MTKELEVIHTQQLLGKEFKVYGTKEEPLFLAKDVAEFIEYTGRTGQFLDMVDEEEKLTHKIYASGQLRNMWFLKEDGVYEVLMQSKKPIAKQFKKQVKQILKDIRNHGMYMTNDVLEISLNDPDMMIGLLTSYKESKEKQRLAEEKQRISEEKLLEAQPAIDFADKCSASEDSILVRELAKLITEKNSIDIGEKRLFSKLRSWGLLLSKGNEPSQRAVSSGYIEVVQSTFKTDYGVKLSRVSRILPKGQIYIINRLKKEAKETNEIMSE